MATKKKSTKKTARPAEKKSSQKTAKKTLAKATAKKPANGKTTTRKVSAKKSFASKGSAQPTAAKRTTKKAMKNAVTKTAKKLASAKLPKKLLDQVQVSVQPGDLVPDFSLPTETGNSVSLADYKGKRVILYFYPKDDTPGCTKESCDFRDFISDVEAKGAIVLGVSKDSVKSHVKFREKYSSHFRFYRMRIRISPNRSASGKRRTTTEGSTWASSAPPF